MVGQNVQETIRLKNGSVLKGQVVGELNDSIALQGTDGSLFIFAVSDVAERTKSVVRHVTVNRQGDNNSEGILSDTLAIETDILKFPRLMQNGIKLNEREVKSMFADNPIAYKHYQNASTLGNLTGILQFATSFIVGWELVDVGLFGKDFNKPLVYIAAGSFISSMCLNIYVNKEVKKAVRAYNNEIQRSTSYQSSDLTLTLGPTSDGLGLSIIF